MNPSKNNLAIDQKVAALKIRWKSYSKILTKAWDPKRQALTALLVKIFSLGFSVDFEERSDDPLNESL